MSSIASESHFGEAQIPRDANFVYDYSLRRVPMPIISYMAISDVSGKYDEKEENPARLSLKLLKEVVEPQLIAEEETDTPSLQKLLSDAFDYIDEKLTQANEKSKTSFGVSLTVVIADRKKAHIFHVGTNKVYLLHERRLYDVTPSVSSSPASPPNENSKLFTESEDSDNKTQVPVPEKIEGNNLLGQNKKYDIAYNEVEIAPGDTIIISSDGLWKNVSGEEIAEDLLSALSIQRSASRLVRLSFSRDASDNATMCAWKYVVEKPEELKTTGRAVQKRKSKARNAASTALMVFVLCAIFAIGFALGWRIGDGLKKPTEKKAEVKSEQAKEVPKETKQENVEKPKQETTKEEAPQTAFPKTAFVKGAGVRMRTSPNPKAGIVGLLRDGQEITILEEVMGTDGKTWSKCRGIVRTGGKDVTKEGYIRSDLLAQKEES
ncbi:MAG: hypothetical protein PHO53_05510 [Actinomycetota bacterium]|nr:hypothetical protein [Actinomycetota bacterium]